MNLVMLVAQGALFGLVASSVPDLTWEFWAACAANAVFVVAYGVFEKNSV